MNEYLKKRYVWWRKLLCYLGSHRLSTDWGIKWSDKSLFTECEYCGDRVTQYNWWAINLDWLRGKFRYEPKYELVEFWKFLTPKWNRIYLIDHRGEVVGRYEKIDLATSVQLLSFIEDLKKSHEVHVRRKSWWGNNDEEYDALQILLYLCTLNKK